MLSSKIGQNILSVSEPVIIKSLQNMATPEEKQLLDNWLCEDEQNVVLYYQFQEVWDSGQQLSDKELAQSWHSLHAKIMQEASEAMPPPVTRPMVTRFGWIRYAAAFLVGFALAAGWYGIQLKGKGAVLVQNVVYNQNGVQKITLPDSSVVWLSAHSRLSYPERFTDNLRQVSVEGDAFFEVRKTAQPFVVHTANVAIHVTGTEFVVQSTPGADIAVALVSGSVTVDARNTSGELSRQIQLVAGQQANIDRNSGDIQLVAAETAYFVAWKDGTYRFTNEPLEKIAAQLSKRYQIKIHIAPELRGRHFTGRVTPDQHIKDVMEIIRVSHSVKYRITKTDLYISEN